MTHTTRIAWARDDPAIPTDHSQAVAAVAPPDGAAGLHFSTPSGHSGTHGGGAGKILKRVQAWLSIRPQDVRRR
jgi:hypothetical protein